MWLRALALGLGSSSVGQCVLSIHMALGSIPSTCGKAKATQTLKAERHGFEIPTPVI